MPLDARKYPQRKAFFGQCALFPSLCIIRQKNVRFLTEKQCKYSQFSQSRLRRKRAAAIIFNIIRGRSRMDEVL